MTNTLEQLTQIEAAVQPNIPDGNDLKGFAGISKDLIFKSLNESKEILSSLSQFENNFEVVILKRIN